MEKQNYTYYEWDNELTRKHGEDFEIIDHDHSDICLGLPDSTPNEYGEFQVLVLVRNVVRNWDLSDRTWAYVKNGQLPEFFQDAWQRDDSKVPQRFHKELAKLT